MHKHEGLAMPLNLCRVDRANKLMIMVTWQNMRRYNEDAWICWSRGVVGSFTSQVLWLPYGLCQALSTGLIGPYRGRHPWQNCLPSMHNKVCAYAGAWALSGLVRCEKWGRSLQLPEHNFHPMTLTLVTGIRWVGGWLCGWVAGWQWLVPYQKSVQCLLPAARASISISGSAGRGSCYHHPWWRDALFCGASVCHPLQSGLL